MSSASVDIRQRHRFTVADYHQIANTGILTPDTRVELIEGEMIDMPPIGSLHAGTVDYLAEGLRAACGGRVIVRVQNPVFLDLHSEPQPDITLLRPRPDFYRGTHPAPADILLLIEVADSTLAYDTRIKLPLYAHHGIPEVWLVDLLNRQFFVHRAPTLAGFQDVQSLTALSAVTPLLLPDVTMDLSRLF